jgi:nucleoside phosphorylase
VDLRAATGDGSYESDADEIYDNLPVQPSDHNTYTLGRIAQHNVVIACLPSGQYSIASASTIAMHLLSSFQCVKVGLLVSISGGIPSGKLDIRLGDVIVGVPSSSNINRGVIQYDLGKAGQGNKFERTSMLNSPPQILLTAISKLRAIHQMEDTQLLRAVREVGRRYPRLHEVLVGCHRKDLLFNACYYHDKKLPTCKSCYLTKLVDRSSRISEEPIIHYGLKASGNLVTKDSHLRDRLGHELGACCVEMEAAGLVNNYPCLVIRGICDYADSHKHKEWQEYAATVAAAYAKQLLSVTPSATGLIRASANKSKPLKKCTHSKG